MSGLREICFHDPEVICAFIIAGCILHNLCVTHDEDIEEFVDVQQNHHPNRFNNIYPNAQGGVQKRQQLMNNSLWTTAYEHASLKQNDHIHFHYLLHFIWLSIFFRVHHCVTYLFSHCLRVKSCECTFLQCDCTMMQVVYYVQFKRIKFSISTKTIERSFKLSYLFMKEIIQQSGQFKIINKYRNKTKICNNQIKL